jgi:colanic acid biosynthesis glycosyl transferase WcaI
MKSAHHKLWIATEIYYPEKTSTGYVLTKLAEGLASAENVYVLCAQPSYERRGVSAPRRERVNGVEIRRVSHPRLDRTTVLGRAVNVMTVTVRMFVSAVRAFRKRDLVIVVTNPPLLPFSIYVAAKLRRASVAVLVHDLYPEAAILAGVIEPASPLARLWMRASDWLFRRVDRIVVLGRDTAELLAPRLSDGHARIRVIPNWADVDEVRPAPPANNELLLSLGIHDRFVLGYAGNMGRVHDIELLLEAAQQLKTAAPNVHMLFVGSGSKAGLVDAVARIKGSNVTLVGPRDRSEQNVFLNACHVSVMALAPGMAGVGVPSRLYNALAAGRPVLAAVDPQSEPARVIREEGVGMHTAPGDVEAFVNAVVAMRNDPALVEAAGRRARVAAVDRFGFLEILIAYQRLVAELAEAEGLE